MMTTAAASCCATHRNVSAHVRLDNLERRVAEYIEQLDESLARLEESGSVDTTLGGDVGERLYSTSGPAVR